MTEPDQAYEDARGEAIVEEHEQHPERFHTVPPLTRTGRTREQTR